MGKVGFDEFKKLDIRVGKVVSAERVKGSKKLVELKIDIGEEVKRAVAGIAEFYSPEEMKGKLVIVVTNLQPRKIFGLESEVMILAAFTGRELAILEPDKEVPPGTEVS
jgi:methionine--tRNA ligase beta chain